MAAPVNNKNDRFNDLLIAEQPPAKRFKIMALPLDTAETLSKKRDMMMVAHDAFAKAVIAIVNSGAKEIGPRLLELNANLERTLELINKSDARNWK